MSKDSNLFVGQPAFKQITSLISKETVCRIAAERGSDRYTKHFDTYSHLLAMLYGIFSDSYSLRELVLGCLVDAGRFRHLGMDFKICRSTLADANARRDSSVFADIYAALYRAFGHVLPDSRSPVKNLHACDSTTITLFSDVLKGCDKEYKKGSRRGKRKGGIKVHALMKLSEGVPCLVYLDAAAVSDGKYMRMMETLGKGSMAVFDRGYCDHAVFEEFSERGIFYATRLKGNVRCEVAEAFPCKAGSGVARDERVLLSIKGSKKKHEARRVEYIDPESGKPYVYITNNFKLKAVTIAKVYKKRWGMELLFKLLKQNFQLKYFYGDSANAIETQVWCVLIACLLMAVFKAMNKIDRMSFSNMMFVVRRVLMEYVLLWRVLMEPERTLMKMLERQNRAQAPPTLFG
jgi:hypothetical protein